MTRPDCGQPMPIVTPNYPQLRSGDGAPPDTAIRRIVIRIGQLLRVGSELPRGLTRRNVLHRNER